MNWQSAISPRLGAKLLLAAAVFATSAFAQRPHVPGRLLVGFNSDVSDSAADEVIRGHQGKSHSRIPGTNTHAVDLNGNANELAVMNAMKNRPEVEYVEFDELIPPSDLTPNDTWYAGQQKYFPQINAPAGWSLSTGNSSVIIAIIDTGVNVNHPDLASKIVQPHSVLTGGTDVTDNYNHGTMTAGTAAALSNNGIGVAGTCWQCLIMPIKVSDGTATTSNIATGLD
jgi:subtilisin family serine protease